MNSCFLRDLLCSLCLVLFIAPSVVAQNPTPPTAKTPSETETSDLAVGKVRQALATQRALIASHPEDPSNYIDLAYTLTDAGITDQASQEVRKATAVAPRSVFAYRAQGWVLHHNVIGVEYGKGLDYDGSLDAYRKAIELDPGDLDAQQSLAELLEYNRNGIRYAPDARLAEAIEILRYVKAHQSAVQPEVEDDLIIDLFYAGRFGEVLPELANLPTSPVRDGVAIATIAAVQGPAAAVERANQIGGDEQKKKDALNFAAEGLWNMQLYPQAAAILTASLPDTTNSKGLLGKIQIFRNLRPYKGVDLPPTDPRYPVQRLVVGGMTNTLTEAVVAQCVSQHPFPSEADWKHNLPEIGSVAGKLWNLSRQTGLPQVVIQDMILGTMKIMTAPSKEPGSRILVEFSGLRSQSFFVINEGGSYKIVASKDGLGEVGTEALYLLHHGQEAEATSLLDWKRDLVGKGQGDDSLGGNLFARLWTTGESGGPRTIELAAASLLSGKSALLSLLPQVIAARKKATTDTERDNFDLLLASIYLRAEDGTNAKLISQQLLNRHSDSATAVALTGQAYSLTKSWSAWKSLLDPRLQTHPNDRSLLLQTAAEAEAEGDLPRARRAFRTLLDSGNALADDYNMYAWLSLFDEQVDDQALEAAQQANLLSKNSNYAYLHTLACLDAARGETAEARQLLLEAMSTGNLEVPNSAIWYGFGRIYEQYGVYDAAAAAYQRVERPDGVIDPTGTFVLAQSRLKALHAN
jgi:tetratricopeptide (TPR) repeat protein